MLGSKGFGINISNKVDWHRLKKYTRKKFVCLWILTICSLKKRCTSKMSASFWIKTKIFCVFWSKAFELRQKDKTKQHKTAATSAATITTTERKRDSSQMMFVFSYRFGTKKQAQSSWNQPRQEECPFEAQTCPQIETGIVHAELSGWKGVKLFTQNNTTLNSIQEICSQPACW